MFWPVLLIVTIEQSTVTAKPHEATFPAAVFAVHVTVVIPGANKLAEGGTHVTGRSVPQVV